MDYKEDFTPEIEYQRVQDAVRRRKVRRSALLCLIVLVPFGAFVFGLKWVDTYLTGGSLLAPVDTVSRYVPNGDKSSFIFQDGTVVTVNAGSRLTYPGRFGFALREVSLDGEAYFEVSKNPFRPFVVKLPGGQKVRVLGTSFNVRAFGEDDEVEVALDEGKVELHNGSEVYTLTPGQAVLYDRASDRAEISACNTLLKSQWTRNAVCFNGAPIDEIASGLSRIFDVKIYIAPGVDRQRLYTFSAKRSDLDLILDELQIIAPICVKRTGDDIMISNR